MIHLPVFELVNLYVIVKSDLAQLILAIIRGDDHLETMETSLGTVNDVIAQTEKQLEAFKGLEKTVKEARDKLVKARDEVRARMPVVAISDPELEKLEKEGKEVDALEKKEKEWDEVLKRLERYQRTLEDSLRRTRRMKRQLEREIGRVRERRRQRWVR